METAPFAFIYIYKPSPGVYFWLYPVFEAVGYGEIQRDTARYSRYSWRYS